MITDPVSNHRTGLVGLDSLHDAVNHMVVHDAGEQAVISVRAAHPVSLNELHPQVILLADIVSHGQDSKRISIHHVGKKRKLLEFVEVVHPVSIAQRAIRPQ